MTEQAEGLCAFFFAASPRSLAQIASLERQAGEEVTAGEGLNKAEASSRIQELKEETGK